MKKFLFSVLCIVTIFVTGLVEAKQKIVDHKDMGKIIVIGYYDPNCDAVASTVAAADFLRQSGYDAEPMVAGTVDAETEYALKTFGMAKPERLENASGKNLFLVAHSGYHAAVKGAKEAYLRGIIDNYNLSGINVVEPIVIVARPYGSTSTLINELYEYKNLKISKSLAGVMMAGILSETLNLKADITTDLDRETVRKLAKRAGVKNVDQFAKEMFEEGWSWKGWSDINILEEDMRTYTSKQGKFTVACIRCHDAEGVEEMKTRMNFFAPKYAGKRGIKKLFIALINLDQVNMEILPIGADAEAIAAQAFKSTEPGKIVLRAGKISRRHNVIPALRGVLDK